MLPDAALIKPSGAAALSSGGLPPSPSGCVRVDLSQSGGAGCVPRSACNYCHDKRVKCVVREGQRRCDQCLNRNTNCIFSIKGKTGPKPKPKFPNAKPDAASRYNRRKSTRRPRRGNEASASPAASTARRGTKTSPQRDLDMTATPVAADTTAGRRERCLLNVYLCTTGIFIPLVEPRVLLQALQERQRWPRAMAAAVGRDRVSSEQAQVSGAISLGGLIAGDMAIAQAYHSSLNYHNGDVSCVTDPMTAPTLGLGALYWQYLGEDQIKDYWLGHIRRVLSDVKEVPVDLMLCIEHFDYPREARDRPGMYLLPPPRQALHIISCLLSSMPNIINPETGREEAVAFCDRLSACTHDLRYEASPELPLLLCESLRALLLVMLGRRQAAADVLDFISQLFTSVSDGSPSMARALPLSWDALVIAAALSFLLDQGHAYRQLRAAIDEANSVPPSARWTFCLPDPGTDARSFARHQCHSSSNICIIVCDIALKTNFGTETFYLDFQSPLRPPALVMPPNEQHGTGFPAGAHRGVYDEDALAVGGTVPSNGWTINGTEPFQSARGSVDGWGSQTQQADTVTPDSTRMEKRRRVKIEADDLTVGGTMLGGSGQSQASWDSPLTGMTTYLSSNSSTVAVEYGNDKERGGFFPPEMGTASGEWGEGFRGRVDEEDRARLSRGLHNMSLSRLSVPLLSGGGVAAGGLHEESPLERVSSEGSMDLMGSHLGNFQTGDGVEGKSLLNHQRLPALTTYSASLSEPGSTLRDPVWRGVVSGDSPAQCGSLSHDAKREDAHASASAGGDADDICKSILSVGEILENIEAESAGSDVGGERGSRNDAGRINSGEYCGSGGSAGVDSLEAKNEIVCDPNVYQGNSQSEAIGAPAAIPSSYNGRASVTDGTNLQ